MLQQYLPFTVLKRSRLHLSHFIGCKVATVLIVHGIETHSQMYTIAGNTIVATVLTVHGIETLPDRCNHLSYR